MTPVLLYNYKSTKNNIWYQKYMTQLVIAEHTHAQIRSEYNWIKNHCNKSVWNQVWL